MIIFDDFRNLCIKVLIFKILDQNFLFNSVNYSLYRVAYL